MINLNTIKTVGYFAVMGATVAATAIAIHKAYKCAKALKCMHDVDRFCEKEGIPESEIVVTTVGDEAIEKSVIRKHLYKCLVIWGLLGLGSAYGAGYGLYIARNVLSNPICYGSFILGAVLFGAVNWFSDRKKEERGGPTVCNYALNVYSFSRFVTKYGIKLK